MQLVVLRESTLEKDAVKKILSQKHFIWNLETGHTCIFTPLPYLRFQNDARMTRI